MPGSQEVPSSCFGFPVSPTVNLVYIQCLPTLISLIQEQSVAMLQDIRIGKVWQREVNSSEEAECISSTNATIFTYSVAAAFAWKSARIFPWYSDSVHLVWTSILSSNYFQKEKSTEKITYLWSISPWSQRTLYIIRQWLELQVITLYQGISPF